MGLSIIVTDYTGKAFERLDDRKNILHRILPTCDEESPTLLTKIDWYGDTYFNYLQLGQFVREWNRLEQRCKEPEEKELFDGARRLANQCQEDRRLLRFIGD